MDRNRYIELKKTWELANTHFIAAQDQLKTEIGELQQKLQEKGGGGGKIEALLVGRTSPLGQKKSLSSEALDMRVSSKVGGYVSLTAATVRFTIVCLLCCAGQLPDATFIRLAMLTLGRFGNCRPKYPSWSLR